jgi:hypothetical protein
MQIGPDLLQLFHYSIKYLPSNTQVRLAPIPYFVHSPCWSASTWLGRLPRLKPIDPESAHSMHEGGCCCSYFAYRIVFGTSLLSSLSRMSASLHPVEVRLLVAIGADFWHLHRLAWQGYVTKHGTISFLKFRASLVAALVRYPLQAWK